MKFADQYYCYLPQVCRAISDAASSTKDYGQALQNSNRRRKKRLRTGASKLKQKKKRR